MKELIIRIPRRGMLTGAPITAEANGILGAGCVEATENLMKEVATEIIDSEKNNDFYAGESKVLVTDYDKGN